MRTPVKDLKPGDRVLVRLYLRQGGVGDVPMTVTAAVEKGAFVHVHLADTEGRQHAYHYFLHEQVTTCV